MITAKFFFTLLISVMTSPSFAMPDAEFFPLPSTKKMAATTQTFSSQLPLKALELLKKHSIWQTTSGLSVPDQAPVLIANRRWLVAGSGQNLILQEQTRLSLERNCETKRNTTWTSAQLDLTGTFRTNDFLIGGPDLCAQPKDTDLTITYLDQDRFVVAPLTIGIAVLFFPAKESVQRAPKEILDSVHLFTSPTGLGLPRGLPDLKIPKDDYLHHDLKKFMPVVLDQSFPDAFISTLEKSLAKWNEAFGSNFFRLQWEKETVDVYDCLSSRKLCLLWSGPPGISFLGASGKTGLTFDPKSGEILGGYIGLIGDAGASLPEAPLTPEIQRFKSEQTTFADIAFLYSKREELSHDRHPMPLWQIGYALTHEIGHFNGLSHNFYGSNEATLSQRTNSVMDYFTLSAVDSKSMNIGKFDAEVIALANRNQAPSADYNFCGDLDSSLEGVSPNPNCNKFDFGRPDQWVMQLSKVSPEGVFAKHPRFSGILLDYLAPFLKPECSDLLPGQNLDVHRFLCLNYGNDPRLFDYLKEHTSTLLICE